MELVTDGEQVLLRKLGRIRAILDNNIPKIVCLCGSTRFVEAFKDANFRETVKGNIVLSIGCNFKANDEAAKKLTDEDKIKLDELHMRKIDLADEILFLNVGKYMGDSTKKELVYSKKQHKFIRFLEKE